ncbi:hypothetical protein M413DRAFT_31571 [Hebeloma cylindrosporum]|uniref:Potassium channel domain-containing protein n=1 Tax=Hebeloma cylindrosporum TaxID=76867 RepID=A0A0C2XEZ9_HEBCY|nr:hypothetical protein M413DRAFT_31571 [Hebeloma cylindrosporum h7]
MNDLGLEDAGQATEGVVDQSIPKHDGAPTVTQEHKSQNETHDHAHDSPNLAEKIPPDKSRIQFPGKRRKHRHHGHKKQNYDEQDEEESSIYQPTLWWFMSTVFPLTAGTFGPVANLFSVCALVSNWRVGAFDRGHIKDPKWVTTLNACSLFLAIIANLALLFNFARRIRYSIAQPITIILWYISSIFLAVAIGILYQEKRHARDKSLIVFTQSYFYALISSVLHFGLSTLLLISTLGSYVFHAYPPSFSTLTAPQRTLMLQTISFSVYLTIGGAVFSAIEGWEFVDGLYWADYTLLTIGLGTDFPLTKTLARMLLIPYAAIGITLIGLVVTSVRGLVLERVKTRVVRRRLGKERERWKEDIQERRRIIAQREMSVQSDESSRPPSSKRSFFRMKSLRHVPAELQKHATRAVEEGRPPPWHRSEFELMRFLEARSKNVEKYTSLGVSFMLVLIIWFFGSVIFWICERKHGGWTYPISIYFTYTTLLTIGYGDFFPTSPSGKPFFIIWSLVAVPAMTVLISNMGDTVVGWVQDATVWACRWTILPEGPALKRTARREKHKIRRVGLKPGNRKEPGDGLSLPPKALSRGSDDVSTSSSSKPLNRNMEDGLPRPFQSYSLPHTTHEPPKTPVLDNRGADTSLEQDIEHIGSNVAHFEEEEGRRDSLAARLAREISILAKDLDVKPPKMYAWEDWVRWLDILGEMETPDGDTIIKESEKAPAGEGVVGASALSALGDTVVAIPHAHVTSTASGSGNADVEWRWTWLSDHGPLFSRLTETEWNY